MFWYQRHLFARRLGAVTRPLNDHPGAGQCRENGHGRVHRDGGKKAGPKPMPKRLPAPIESAITMAGAIVVSRSSSADRGLCVMAVIHLEEQCLHGGVAKHHTAAHQRNGDLRRPQAAPKAVSADLPGCRQSEQPPRLAHHGCVGPRWARPSRTASSCSGGKRPPT